MDAPKLEKRIFIIAGPNGAGKSTFAKSFLPNISNLSHFLNADDIEAGLATSGTRAGRAIKAGRQMLADLDKCAENGETFAFETTLAGTGYLGRIQAWRAQGYRVTLFFLSLPSVEVAIERVAQRVMQGGHGIPELAIKNRFTKGLENFHACYKGAVNDWTLYDSSGPEVVIISKGRNFGE